MNTRAVKSPWSGALTALAGIAVVSVIALVKDWSFGSWSWAAALCVVTGVSSAVTQARRNRRLDLAIEQRRAEAASSR
ncbi:hypothetical protein JIG36_34000 [Actinoplanes sp. LDG1-06]|uniref:Uncharacterized protein n=1 Tax=Paractinoplanes ovalisporus TaxID=2810368 RepID=A0ABS2AMS5_9ACTN|nr:hypothetical protein [Actinoplanes ovalisporus]MBM2620526.1 hypothetical protein [Actinoplanes ovalisporus]